MLLWPIFPSNTYLESDDSRRKSPFVGSVLAQDNNFSFTFFSKPSFSFLSYMLFSGHLLDPFDTFLQVNEDDSHM